MRCSIWEAGCPRMSSLSPHRTSAPPAPMENFTHRTQALWSWPTLLAYTSLLGGCADSPTEPAGSVVADFSIADLGTLGGCCSGAWAINDQGQVVGWSRTDGGEYHAAFWQVYFEEKRMQIDD